MISVSHETFDKLVLEPSLKRPVVLDLWAEWCGPCKMLTPVIEELSNDFKDRAIIAKVNVDESPGIAQKYSIRSIPSLLFFRRGSVRQQLVGVASKQDITNTKRYMLGLTSI